MHPILVCVQCSTCSTLHVLSIVVLLIFTCTARNRAVRNASKQARRRKIKIHARKGPTEAQLHVTGRQSQSLDQGASLGLSGEASSPPRGTKVCVHHNIRKASYTFSENLQVFKTTRLCHGMVGLVHSLLHAQRGLSKT